jgi:hypothetical protein
MKVVYIGVSAPSPPPGHHLANSEIQLFKKDSDTARELTSERKLTTYNYFTQSTISQFVRRILTTTTRIAPSVTAR